MKSSVPDLPRSAWWIIVQRTCYVVAVSIGISLLVTYLIMTHFSRNMGFPVTATALALPIVLGGPLSFHFILQQQRLKLLNAELAIVATIDSLTGCLNRGAFTKRVDDYMAIAGDTARGALLVIDADDFKQVNDRFGHDLGDHALQEISGAIRVTTRQQDLVGRIGGEEFAVFLAGADFLVATRVAERIRCAVSSLRFAPGGSLCPLSISVGGALFESATPFMALYRQADQRLYEAKHLGRDRVAMLPDAA